MSSGPFPWAGSGTVSWDRYQVLINRNVFSKSRGRVYTSVRTVAPPPPPPNPEVSIVLVGVAEKDGELVAFFENRKTGTIQKVRKDESIARGKITAITINHIEYNRDGHVLVVTMGTNLEGATSAATPAVTPTATTKPATTTPAATTATTPAATTPGAETVSAPAASATPPSSGEAGSILERMRRKRLEEMNK